MRTDPTRSSPLVLAVTLVAACQAGAVPPDGGLDAAVAADAAQPVRPCPTACLPGLRLPDGAQLLPDGRGVYLRCPDVGLALSVLDPAIVRLRYGDAAPTRASLALDDPTLRGFPPPDLRYGVTCGGDLVLCTSELAIEANGRTCRLRARAADGTVLIDDGDDGGYRRGSERVDGEPRPTQEVVRHSPAGEHFYGLGAKLGPLDRRGGRFTLWNTDAYDDRYGGYAPDADPLYESIPLLIGLRPGAAGPTAYGLLFDNTFRMIFDLASGSPDRYQVTAFGGELDQYLLAGPSLAAVTERYTRLTGRPPLPPRWTLGYHQSRWGYTEADLRRVAAELRRRQLPADGLWLDIQHMRGFRSFTWDPAAFPDPDGLVADLQGAGFKTTVIVDPGLKVDPGWDLYDRGLAAGLFLGQNGDGKGQPYVGKVWPGDAVFPDFSLPAARQLFGEQAAAEARRGVRGLWLDMNEPANMLVGSGGSLPDGIPLSMDGRPTTMAELHNVYALLEAQGVRDGLLAGAPGRRPFLLSRAAAAGSQRYTAVWTGDAPSTFPTLRGTLPLLLNLGLSGLTFAGSDVGGYSGGATPELFARWLALGSISPFFRGHVTSGAAAQEPWAFGQEVEDISRALIAERYRLLPYLYSLFALAAERGEPILRPLVYELQADPETHGRDDEAMLGPWLLYAPVLEAGAASRRVYLPAGRWFEYRSGAAYDGPLSFDLPLTLATLPAFVRAGAILPHGPLGQFTDEKPLDELFLDLYPGPAATGFTLYEDDGDSLEHLQPGGRGWARTTYSLTGTATGATLVAGSRSGGLVPAARLLRLRFRRVDADVQAIGLDTGRGAAPLGRFASQEAVRAAGRGYFYDANDRSVTVLLAAAESVGPFTLTLRYDGRVVDLRPPVDVPLRVHLPADTPADATIYVATSANGWTQQPLSRSGPDTAVGTVTVGRGVPFQYKYTRGGWDTVEKWPGCAEATNRYGLGAAWPVQEGQVAMWADRCHGP